MTNAESARYLREAYHQGRTQCSVAEEWGISDKDLFLGSAADVGRCLGTTRNTVNRRLSRMRDEGYNVPNFPLRGGARSLVGRRITWRHREDA